MVAGDDDLAARAAGDRQDRGEVGQAHHAGFVHDQQAALRHRHRAAGLPAASVWPRNRAVL